MKKIVLFLLLLTPVFAFSQSRKMKKAAQFMEILNYEKAIKIYHKIIEKNNNPTAQIALASAYLKNKDYKNASEWYSKIILLPEAGYIDYLNNGLLYLRAGACEKAQVNFDVFLKLKPYDTRKEQLSNACLYYEELLAKNTNRLIIDSLDISTSKPELGTAFFKNGIVYSAVRPEVNHGISSFDLYFAPIQMNDSTGLALGEAHTFAPSLNTLLNEAIPTFDRKFETIFFTRNQKKAQKKNIYKLEILESHYLKADVWSKPKVLSFAQKEYSYAHPALSPAGNQLFFASDMPGGFGGIDIYVSNYENDTWGKPINLGPKINTEGDELYPYYRKDGTLFFASDGQIGLGGQDIFKSKQTATGEWQKVENCGAKINSPFDDFGITFSENFDYGFFSSNRTSGKGYDDIYYFKQTDFAPNQIIFLSNLETQAAIQSPVNCIQLCDSTQVVITSPFYKNKIDNCCKIILQTEGFHDAIIDLCDTLTTQKDTLNIYLSPKHSTLSGLFVDKTTALPISGAIVSLQSDCGVLTTVTDSEGKYQFILKEDCCYNGQIQWKESKLPFSKTYCSNNGTHNYTLTNSYKQTEQQKQTAVLNKKISDVFDVSHSNTPNQQKEVVFLIELYYDVGRASVRKAGIREMKKLLTLLKKNPSISIEISSHTDAVGSDKANLKLSHRRAVAIKKWLVKKGIHRDRLIAIGYGESRPVNHCIDGIKCNEAELQLNRRTEFKLLTTTVSSGY